MNKPPVTTPGSTPRLSKDDNTARAIQFTMKLGRALHLYGAPSHRLEEAMSIAAGRLGITGQFFVTPTALFAAFSWDDQQETLLERLEPGGVDLGKLAQLDAVIEDVAERRATPTQASERVDAILVAAPQWGAVTSTFSFALTSMCATRFFGGGWRELLTAMFIGLFIGLLALVAGRQRNVVRLFEPVAALMATLIAIAMAAWLPPTNVFIATLGGLIVLVPGLTLTIAMTEIATRPGIGDGAPFQCSGVVPGHRRRRCAWTSNRRCHLPGAGSRRPHSATRLD